MNKGQLFSMDALLSIMGITIILGLVTTQFSLVFDQYNEAVFERLELIASDMNNIALARIMAHDFSGKPSKTAVINKAKMAEYELFLKNTLGNKYSAEVNAFGNDFQVNGGCNSKDINKASSRRLAMDYGSKKVTWFETMVCYNE